MKKTMLFLSVALIAAIVTACQSAAASAPQRALAPIPRLKPGDKVGDMIVTTGQFNRFAPSIWAFCSPQMGSTGVVTLRECRVPPLPLMIVGAGWTTRYAAQRDADWSAMTWELYIDGQPVDLAAFGTFDADRQDGTLRAWNAVLEPLTSGAQHTLRHVLHLSQPAGDLQTGTYELVVKLTVDDRVGRRRVVK